VIKDALPILSRKIDPETDYDLILVVRDVAHALAYKGRWSEVDAVFQQAQKARRAT
jgi:hypothetical protein